jgi:Spy/CpxP family protein refolding chaperone
MKKLLVFLCCLVIGLFAHNAVSARTTVVRFLVELPGQGISQDSAVYIAGSFNGWNPKDENYRMTRKDSHHYELDVPCFADKNYEYKYTLGGWDYVEKTIDGKDIDNRKFTSLKKLKIKDSVFAWNVPAPKKDAQNSLSAMLSKEQIAQMMQMKDSITKNLAPVIPQLMGILKKFNSNLLADRPDRELQKQYNGEAVGIVSQILESLTNTLIKVSDVLTPEQKQKLRDAMKNSTNPGDLINMITNSKAEPSDK